MHLSKPEKKTLLICIGFSLLIFIFYVSKKTVVNYFISKFTQQKPYVHAIHPKPVNFTKNYHTVGEFKALKMVQLSPSIGGEVKSIFFEANDEIREGQLLVQLDDKVEAAQKKFQWAEYQLQKKLHAQYMLLWEKHNISKTQFLESQAGLEKSKAAYHQAKAQWELKKIRAPFAGTIGIPNLYPGLYISPGQKDLVQLIQRKPLYIDFHLPEKYFSHVHAGDFIKLKSNNQAKIVAIEPVSKQLAHTILVRAEISNDDLAFIPGQFIQLKIPVSSSQNLLTVPSSCLVSSPKGTFVMTAVYSAKHKAYQVIEKPIKLSQNFGGKSIITSGIQQTDWIIDAGTQKIQNGQLIQLQKNI
jgi:membrane fusion protein (multidrug efflux system)